MVYFAFARALVEQREKVHFLSGGDGVPGLCYPSLERGRVSLRGTAPRAALLPRVVSSGEVIFHLAMDHPYFTIS